MSERGSATRTAPLAVTILAVGLFGVTVGQGRGQARRPVWKVKSYTTQKTQTVRGLDPEFVRLERRVDATLNEPSDKAVLAAERDGYEPFAASETYVPNGDDESLGIVYSTLWLRKAE